MQVTPVAGIEYLIGNLILYVALLPVMFAGWAIYEIHESYAMRRQSREHAGKPPTPADRIARGFEVVFPWLVAGLVALFDVFMVAMFIYVIVLGKG
jgi:Ser/Thr protein kinase RdoA (MazF antagonist)